MTPNKETLTECLKHNYKVSFYGLNPVILTKGHSRCGNYAGLKWVLKNINSCKLVVSKQDDKLGLIEKGLAVDAASFEYKDRTVEILK